MVHITFFWGFYTSQVVSRISCIKQYEWNMSPQMFVYHWFTGHLPLKLQGIIFLDDCNKPKRHEKINRNTCYFSTCNANIAFKSLKREKHKLLRNWLGRSWRKPPPNVPAICKLTARSRRSPPGATPLVSEWCKGSVNIGISVTLPVYVPQ